MVRLHDGDDSIDRLALKGAHGGRLGMVDVAQLRFVRTECEPAPVIKMEAHASARQPVFV